MHPKKQYIVIEKVVLESVWFLYWRLKKIVRSGESLHVFYIDGHKFAILLLGYFIKRWGGAYECLDFRLMDIKSEKDNLRHLQIVYEDLVGVQDKIMQDPFMKKVVDYFKEEFCLYSYLKKKMISANLGDSSTIMRGFFIIHVALWKVKQLHENEQTLIVIAKKRLWIDIIQGYAQKKGVIYEEVFVASIVFKQLVKVFLKNILFWSMNTFSLSQSKEENNTPRVLVDYYGHLYLDDPKMFSDLFFYQQSNLKGKNILLSFSIPSDPLSEEKMRSLNRHHIKSVVFDPRAGGGLSVATFYEQKKSERIHWPEFLLRNNDQINKWFRNQIKDYYQDVTYWKKLFKRHQVKIHTSWYKYDAQHMVITEAIRQTGGIASIYQRAFEEFLSPKTAISTDIIFGFSRDIGLLEKKSSSQFSYYIVTGWLGDHRFDLLKPMAQDIRAKLQMAGAHHILAYFDEGSLSDERFHTGHGPMQENYKFLLNKVLSRQDIGLVIKPKIPKTLRHRLGVVAELLQKAEKTGRCLVLSKGSNIVGSFPPALAALVADVTVHGCFAAASAGVEAILAGARTIMFDGEWWSKSCLYGCSKDKRVFRDWEKLWGACERFWKSSDDLSNFGYWQDKLDFFDPFRDGKAAYRMGTFLEWLIQGFDFGLDRKKNMEQAVDRYKEIWGQDKVILKRDK